MKKVLLVVLAILLGASQIYAQCITSDSVIMYIDHYRAAAWLNAVAVSLDDGMALLMRDTEEGSAVLIPKGTKVRRYEVFQKGIAVVEIGNKEFITHVNVIRTICK